jgi:tetratricopeptide (TPR) repeat protein
MKDRDYSRALDYFNELKPSGALVTELMVKKGEIYYKNKNYDEASLLFRKALETMPLEHKYFRETLYSLCTLLADSGQYAEAVKIIEKYSSAGEPRLQYILALSLFSMKKYAPAADAAENILEHPQDAELNYKAFLLLMGTAEAGAGPDTAQKYLSLMKNNRYLTTEEYIAVILRLAKLHIENKKYSPAADILQYSLTLDAPRQKEDILRSLYLCQEYLGQEEKAVKTLDSLLDITENRENAIFYLYEKARLYKKSGDSTRYRKELRKILEFRDFPENKFYQKAVKELAAE